jgi:uncharacterized protein (TIGR03067 family)
LAPVLLLYCLLAAGRPAVLAQERARERVHEKELAALQGSWRMLRYESNGELQPLNRIRWLVKGRKIRQEVDGQVAAEWPIEHLDPERTPAHLDLRSDQGLVRAIYVRSGDYIIWCNSQVDGKRPTEFATGTEAGGFEVIVWKIER